MTYFLQQSLHSTVCSINLIGLPGWVTHMAESKVVYMCILPEKYYGTGTKTFNSVLIVHIIC